MPEKLPKGWIKATLGEVCEVNPRPSFDESVSDSTEVSFVPMSAVEEENGRLDASQVRTLAAVRKGYTPFKENDVIFAKITPCMENGKIALATGLKNGLAFGSTEFFVFRSREGVLPHFILYFLLQPKFREEAERQMTGASGQKRVPKNYLVNREFLLPPTREQERIIAKLDAALLKLERAGIAAQRATERLKYYHSAVLRAAVTGELTHDWRKANKPIESGHQYLQHLLQERRSRWEEAELQRIRTAGKSPKDEKWKSGYREPVLPNTENLPKLPTGWIWVSLDQLGELNRGKSKHRPRDDARLYTGPYPFIQTGDIRRSRGTIQKHTQTYSEFGLKQSRLWPKGTLCITIAANIAETGILTYPACFPDSVVGFVQDDARIKVRFVEYFIRSEKSKLENYAPATAQKNINLEFLSGLAIPLPPLDEQAEIVREVEHRLSAADRLAAALSRQMDRARVTRQSLLSEAFTGQLVPQDPNDKSASVLLNRIQISREAEAKKPKGKRMSKPKPKTTRRPLLDVLREHKGPMTPETLFRDSGFEAMFNESEEPQDIVDVFYKELRKLTDKPAKVSEQKSSKQEVMLRVLL